MTMGLKVRALLSEKEIKKRAEARKAESDAILETIYSLLQEINKRFMINFLKIVFYICF